MRLSASDAVRPWLAAARTIPGVPRRGRASRPHLDEMDERGCRRVAVVRSATPSERRIHRPALERRIELVPPYGVSAGSAGSPELQVGPPRLRSQRAARSRRPSARRASSTSGAAFSASRAATPCRRPGRSNAGAQHPCWRGASRVPLATPRRTGSVLSPGWRSTTGDDAVSRRARRACNEVSRTVEFSEHRGLVHELATARLSDAARELAIELLAREGGTGSSSSSSSALASSARSSAVRRFACSRTAWTAALMLQR